MALSLEQLTEQNRIQKKQIELLVEAIKSLSDIVERQYHGVSRFNEIFKILRSVEHMEIIEGKRFD